MRSRRIFVLGVGLLAASISAAGLYGQSASSTRDGVYTGRQAQQGKALYAVQCGMCHGKALDGMGSSPALTGGDFLDKWSGQTLGDLATKIRSTMPMTKPGSLTADQTAQLVALILQANSFPAGKSPLPASAAKLKAIRIERP